MQASRLRILTSRFSATVLAGTSLNPINSSIIATALVPIASAFGVSTAHAAMLVAAVYAASAIAQPVFGRIAEIVDPWRVFGFGALIVLAGSAMGCLAHAFAEVLVARILVGVGTSAMYPTSMMLIRLRSAGHARSSGLLIGAVAISGSVFAAAGLPLGGLLVSQFGWRGIFWVNLPLAVGTVALAAAERRRTPRFVDRPQRGGRAALADLDLIGMALVATMICALVVTLDNLPRLQVAGLAVTVAATAIGLVWEWRAPAPFFDIRTLCADAALALTYLRTLLSFVIFYAVIYGVTPWLQVDQHRSAALAGAVVLPATAVSSVSAIPTAARGFIRVPLLMAAAAAVLGGAGLVILNRDSGVIMILLVTSMFGVTVGCANSANQAAVFAEADLATMGRATGLLRTFVYLGAIGASAAISVAYGGRGATYGNFHALAWAILVLGVALLVVTAVDRRLPQRLGERPTAGHL